MPTIEWNLDYWNNKWGWNQNGDEFCGQAKFCNQPYDLWKQSVVDWFLKPNISKSTISLEIACGQGRWTRHLCDLSLKVVAVDLCPKCIDFCKKAFQGGNAEFFKNNGNDLGFVPDESIDFIWSYDSFVHMEKDTIQGYFHEFRRVMKPESVAIIHHSGGNDIQIPPEKWNISSVSKGTICNLADTAGLKVISQVQSWGENNQFDCKQINSYISRLEPL